MKKALLLSLSLSRFGSTLIYLGSDILGGSYVQVTTANINNIINNIINESFPSNNLYPQSYSNNPYA